MHKAVAWMILMGRAYRAGSEGRTRAVGRTACSDFPPRIGMREIDPLIMSNSASLTRT